MMVTFISECEKKALNRTRRVLDSFANRIGRRTWQTVITEEGLDAVKKLLRKTASKNTAVSCHWIRSRSRSDLLWIVGNQNKFNLQGIVPVNYTSKPLIMDKIPMKTETIYANTQKQPLNPHLFAVGYLAYRIILDLTGEKTLAYPAYIAGCMHDIGKIEGIFQEWLKNKLIKEVGLDVPEDGQHVDKTTLKVKPTEYPRHNEVSMLLFYLLNKQAFQNDDIKDYVEHVIYWHHAKWLRDKDFNSFSLDMVYNKLKKHNGGDESLNEIYRSVVSVISNINHIYKDYIQDSKEELLITVPYSYPPAERLQQLEKTDLPDYKFYRLKENVGDYKANISKNAIKNLIRNAVITADQKVSKISGDKLAQHIENRTLLDLLRNDENNSLMKNIEKCLDGFSNSPNADKERNEQQAFAARKLTKTEEDISSVKVLQGPAGCGKTKIALEWATKTQAKKIIWICPRVLICQGLINDLTNKSYLPESKIEIYTGEFKKIYQSGNEPYETPKNEVFSGDIVVTTIDQIINSIITHKHITVLSHYMNSHVVFDEFHEYINMPAFNLLFAELVQCKAFQKERAKAILVSATPNYYFVNKFLGISDEEIVSVPSFNQSLYKFRFIQFDEKIQNNNPLFQSQPENTFVICNTATNAQKSYIANQHNEEKTVLLHAKFTKNDKARQFEKTIACFGKNPTDYKYDLLRSGPIVQASLNISCGLMIAEFTFAENWLQRLGRLNRFGENVDGNLYISAITDEVIRGKQLGSCARNLNRENGLQSAKVWYEFLQDKIKDDESYTLSEIYELYKIFYKQSATCRMIEQDFLQSLNESIKVLNLKLFDPVDFKKKNKIEPDKIKLAKYSLRGDSRFVKLAFCQTDGLGNFKVLEDYCCDENNTNDVMTLPFRDIEENGLLDEMCKNHEKLLNQKGYEYEEIQPRYRKKAYLSKARDSEFPIYLSYTEADLSLIHAQPHSEPIYYAIDKKQQPIGAMSKKDLNN